MSGEKKLVVVSSCGVGESERVESWARMSRWFLIQRDLKERK